MQTDSLVIPVALRDALVNYLAQRPYAEVATAVQALQSLQAIEGAKDGDS